MLPTAERNRVASHLPSDVGDLLVPPQRLGSLRHIESIDQLFHAVTASGLVSPTHAPWVVQALLVELRQMVPEEADGVAALLPPDVRALWETPLQTG